MNYVVTFLMAMRAVSGSSAFTLSNACAECI